ncbi:MAG: hypothetical protein GC201_08610 [Alphaproteobacteria bacterium]|nr:hypothetical protein [Alphaproteobacteria bacterium]
MKTLAVAAIAALLPLGAAHAFQVITPGEMKDAGLGFAQSSAFRQSVDPQTDSNFHFSAYGGGQNAGDNRLRYNQYGRVDGGGRYLGDYSSTFRSCGDYSDNNTAELDALSVGGNAYPCQRFR